MAGLAAAVQRETERVSTHDVSTRTTAAYVPSRGALLHQAVMAMSRWLLRRLVADGTDRVCRTAQRVAKRRGHTDVLAEPRNLDNLRI